MIGASGVDALLAGDEADAVLPDFGRQPPVRLLREHAQRRRVDAAAVLDEEAQRVVRLAGVRRAEMRDHASPARGVRSGSRTVSSETGLRAGGSRRW